MLGPQGHRLPASSLVALNSAMGFLAIAQGCRRHDPTLGGFQALGNVPPSWDKQARVGWSSEPGTEVARLACRTLLGRCMSSGRGAGGTGGLAGRGPFPRAALPGLGGLQEGRSPWAAWGGSSSWAAGQAPATFLSQAKLSRQDGRQAETHTTGQVQRWPGGHGPCQLQLPWFRNYNPAQLHRDPHFTHLPACPEEGRPLAHSGWASASYLYPNQFGVGARDLLIESAVLQGQGRDT